MLSYTVFAGVNGAGKSTMYCSFEDLHREGRVNCDDILREFNGDWRNEEDQFKSGQIALKRIEDYLENEISFSQETTLSSKNAIRNAVKARNKGFYTELHFVYVDSAEIAIERIKNRVKDGGHDVPDELVRSRFVKSLNNLAKAIEVFDAVFIYDNTVNFEGIAVYYRGEMEMCLDTLPNWFKSFLDRH